MTTYKFIDAEQTIVAVFDADGISRTSGYAYALVPEGAVVEPYVAPQPTIHDQIATIEASITQRRLRDAVLTESGAAWLAEKEAQIEMLRQQLI